MLSGATIPKSQSTKVTSDSLTQRGRGTTETPALRLCHLFQSHYTTKKHALSTTAMNSPPSMSAKKTLTVSLVKRMVCSLSSSELTTHSPSLQFQRRLPTE